MLAYCRWCDSTPKGSVSPDSKCWLLPCLTAPPLTCSHLQHLHRTTPTARLPQPDRDLTFHEGKWLSVDWKLPLQEGDCDTWRKKGPFQRWQDRMEGKGILTGMAVTEAASTAQTATGTRSDRPGNTCFCIQLNYSVKKMTLLKLWLFTKKKKKNVFNK